MIEDIGALIVSHDENEVEGVLSQRDVVLGIAEYGSDVLRKPVRFPMTNEVQACSPDERINNVKRVTSRRRIRHLHIVEKGKLCGNVSILDIVPERRCGSSHRPFRMPEGVDAKGVSAHLSEGVLNITLPKAKAEKPRKIPTTEAD